MVSCKIPREELDKFAAAMRAIAQVSQVNGEEVVRGEAGVILKTWAGRTKVATEAKAVLRGRKRLIKRIGLTSAPDPGDISINVGLKGQAGRVWVRSPAKRHGHPAGRPFRIAGMLMDDGSFTASPYHQKNAIWGQLMRTTGLAGPAIARAVAAAKKTIGLGRQSIIQIADRLGIKLETVKGGGALGATAIAKARAALASNGQLYVNGLASVSKTADHFSITLINNYPRGMAQKMDSTLAGVIAGRVKFFERNMGEGVFLAQSRVAKAYPFLQVNRN